MARVSRLSNRPLQQVQSLDRGLTILSAVASSSRPVTLGELTTVLGINRSSVFRLAATLKRRGFLASLPGRKDYILGPSVEHLSEQYDRYTLFIQLSREPLQRLAAEANETANIAVKDGTQVRFLNHALADNVLLVSGQTGRRVDLHCASLGKALLVDATERDLKALYGSGPLRAYTKNTITSIKELARACAQARKTGYAIDDAEFRDDLCCVAAPIRAADGTVTAAIGISAPSSRLSAAQFRTQGHVVIRYAAEISALLKKMDQSVTRPGRGAA
jgi:DNA-binding IclR family transcriptional regulator